MRSNNPVFNRSPEFSGQPTNAYGNQTYPGNGAPHGGYGQPGQSDPVHLGHRRRPARPPRSTSAG